MSMKPWEREIIEYRPNIGLEQTILSTIVKRANSDSNRIYKPTAKVMARTKLLGIDVIDNIIATLSKLHELKNYIDKLLIHNPTFINYKGALSQGDYILADEIHEANLIDITGVSELDVYPIIDGHINELTTYLDRVNKVLFAGKVDYSNTSSERKSEEDYIQAIIQIESEELSLQIRPVMTQQQLAMVQKLIEDPNEPINSTEDYIRVIHSELRNRGASGIDYDKLADDSQIIYSYSEKANMFRKSTDSIGNYIYSSLESFVDSDIQGSLRYLSDTVDLFHDIMDSLGTSHQYYANESLSSYHNMKRVSDQETREMLDERLSGIKDKKARLVNTLLQSFQTDNQSAGAISIRQGIREGVQSADNLWTFILTEHIGTTEMNDHQLEEFYKKISKKKQHRSLFRYTDLVSREFDFDNKERELKTFAQTHNLHTLR